MKESKTKRENSQMSYQEIELAILWEKSNKNQKLSFLKRENYYSEVKEIFNNLLENKVIDELIEKCIRKYRSSNKDPIIEGLELAKQYIRKEKLIYTKEDFEEVDQAIKQINKVRYKVKRT